MTSQPLPIASANGIATIAALIGDPARANILSALMGGQALTAGELAWHAGVGAPTTSGHLAKLSEAGLLAVERQGRHRYYRLASPDIAQVMESLMAVATAGPRRHRPPGPKDEALRTARTCYDHLAGRLGTTLADRMNERGLVILGDGGALVTGSGHDFLSGLGLAFPDAGGTRRPLCRVCLDWSERRSHLAGRLGAALLSCSLERGWIVRIPDSRAVAITEAGSQGFATVFGITPELLAADSSLAVG
ncbi:helix-turn-helix transcriptional regulator [Azospirillum sp. YIM B02556]|uniref:Helix-turn-helix transcriptional regulator n=1 Tax=Azospirillum endophyticum TaxID=2800326 RepID=A0ABS1FCZ9_9PROT|nr:metalloregulator ArsR/SmtB family transcription factor [Azospirillum endophyticum]MBK1841312.1 helix-turn-helix transcriptional regulator [Azospirillum endophyticum]